MSITYKLRKSMVLLSTLIFCGGVTVISGAAADSQSGLGEVALSLERALPGFVSTGDYRSASNTAFLLATARSRLHQTADACAALSQSLEYYRMAIAKETGLREAAASGLNEQSDGMSEVRSKFGCTRT
jgi:hypothetical protein